MLLVYYTDLDVCGHTSPCQNNVNCTNSASNDYTCICVEGYEGKNCHQETDDCIQNQCQNGGICKVCSCAMTSFNLSMEQVP